MRIFYKSTTDGKWRVSSSGVECLCHTFRFWKLYWWKPILRKEIFATGRYDGWHFWWGPIHIWNFRTHNKKKYSGVSWRMKPIKY